MASFIGLIQRWRAIGNPPEAPKSSNPIRFGLLGASKIAPAAIIRPARSHADVIIVAIAARDQTKAQAYAKLHNIPRVHTSYQDLLNDPEVDAIYVPLPNNLHFEWALRSLRAGKHVLLEKPSVSNGSEAKSLFDFYASMPEPKPVLLEAFHYLFHPSWQTFLSVIDIEAVENAKVTISAPKGFVKAGDIRYRYELSGGAMMDLGSYASSVLRQVLNGEPEECASSQMRRVADDDKCDEAAQVEWRFPGGRMGSIDIDLTKSGWFGLPTVQTMNVVVKHREIAVVGGESEGQSHKMTKTVTNWGFLFPSSWHRIDVVDDHVIYGAHGTVVKRWTVKEYKKAYIWGDLQRDGTKRVGEEWWVTYRHMLEQFVNQVRGRQGSGVWFEGENSVKQMEMIDGAYLKAGLPFRPTSEYK